MTSHSINTWQNIRKERAKRESIRKLKEYGYKVSLDATFEEINIILVTLLEKDHDNIQK